MTTTKIPPGPWRWINGNLLDRDGRDVLWANCDERISVGVGSESSENIDGDHALAEAITMFPQLVVALAAVVAEARTHGSTVVDSIELAEATLAKVWGAE